MAIFAINVIGVWSVMRKDHQDNPGLFLSAGYSNAVMLLLASSLIVGLITLGLMSQLGEAWAGALNRIAEYIINHG